MKKLNILKKLKEIIERQKKQQVKVVKRKPKYEFDKEAEERLLHTKEFIFRLKNKDYLTEKEIKDIIIKVLKEPIFEDPILRSKLIEAIGNSLVEIKDSNYRKILFKDLFSKFLRERDTYSINVLGLIFWKVLDKEEKKFVLNIMLGIKQEYIKTESSRHIFVLTFKQFLRDIENMPNNLDFRSYKRMLKIKIDEFK